MRTGFALLLGGWLLLSGTAVNAREAVMGMTKVVYDVITEVQEMFDEERWQEALEKLESWRDRRVNNYERGHLLNMTGFALYEQDRLPEALAVYREALALDGLPDSQVRQLLMTASQVALVVEDYTAAEAYARRLVESPGKTPPQPISWVILAQALIGQENWAGAIAPLQTAIEKTRVADGVPKENWLSMLSAVYYNLERYPEMRDVLYELVSLYPSERYLINLAALHGQLGETDRQLALVESLLDDQRLDKSHHLMSLANLFLAHQLPFKAASLLEQEIGNGRIEATQRNLELVSQAWYLAGHEEKAIPPLARAAALAEDGSLYLRVARLHMDLYQWEEALAAAGKAEKKGELKDPGDALLLQGMALARLEKFDLARSTFRRAEKHDKSRRTASQWLKFIANEEQRIAALTVAPD